MILFQEKPQISKPPSAKNTEKTISVGWINDDEYVTLSAGGGTAETVVTGDESYQDLLDIILTQFPTGENHITGLKFGRSANVISCFNDKQTLKEHCRLNKLYLSKTKIYLVTKTKEIIHKCTCEEQFPSFELNFLFDDVTLYSKSSVKDYLKTQNPGIRDISNVDFNPLLEGCTLKKIFKCQKCRIGYIDWVPGTQGISYVYKQIAGAGSEEFGSSKILHGPEEIHGNAGGEFIGVIHTQHHNRPFVQWYRNGELFIEGDGLLILWLSEPGIYYAQVGQSCTSEFAFRCLHTKSASGGKRKKKIDPGTAKVMKEKIPQDEIRYVAEGEIQFDSRDDNIGEGTFGRVFKANYHGTPVAYKVFKLPKRNTSNAIHDILQTEARIHCSLHHPNIIQLIGVVLNAKHIGLVCEYLPTSLEAAIFGEENEDTNDASTIVIPDSVKQHISINMLQGLAYLHAKNVIHADIKPPNILLSKDYTVVKLCDMGLSRVKKSLCATKTRSTVAGTVMYMSPENLLCHIHPNKESDVWAVSATLCELYSMKSFWELSGKDDEKDVMSKMRQKLEPDALQCLRKHRTIHKTLKRGLCYDASKRPSVEQLLMDIRDIAWECTDVHGQFRLL